MADLVRRGSSSVTGKVDAGPQRSTTDALFTPLSPEWSEWATVPAQVKALLGSAGCLPTTEFVGGSNDPVTVRRVGSHLQQATCWVVGPRLVVRVTADGP